MKMAAAATTTTTEHLNGINHNNNNNNNDRCLSTPLLQPNSSDHSQHIILPIINNNNNYHAPPQKHQTNHHAPNPYEFLGACEPLKVPPASTIDPFRNHTERIETVYEVIKIVVCIPIAAVRLVLFGLCLLVGYVATVLALQGWKDKNNPMPKWRSRIMWITRACARCILFSFGYQWIRRKGKPAPREIAPIVVSNHVSYIEPIFYFYELFPAIVASESHDAMPFVGTIIRAMQVIYVNRFCQASRKNTVNEIKRKASCDRFPRVLLFPEGTTTNGKAIISFQLGAFIPGYAIQPVVVRYPHIHFDQSWGNISLAMLMFRMFTQFHNFLEVEYLPIVSPLDNLKQTPAHFADRTSHSIATALNVVQTSHSYGDVMLLMKASEAKQENPSSYMVEMARVEKSYHLSSLEAVEFLDKFLSMNPDQSGRVNYYGFLKVLRLRSCSLSEEIFQFVDVESKGSITFKQYLYASANVRRQPQFRHTCDIAFTMCDVGGQNQILEKEFGDTIRLAMPDLDGNEIQALFNIFDTEGEGRVCKGAFITSLRKNPLLIALFSPCLTHKAASGDDGILDTIV